MSVSSKFLESYDSKVRETLYTNFTRVVVSKGFTLGKDLDTYAFSLYQMMYPVDVSDGDTATALKIAKETARQQDEFKVCEFLALVYVNSYYGLSNLDSITQFDEGNPNKFGFADAVSSLSTHLTLSGIPHSATNGAEKSALQRLASIERRSVSPSDYIEKVLDDGSHYYEIDLQFVYKLFNERRDVEVDDEYGGVYEEVFLDTATRQLKGIREVYEALLSAAFGITPYVGIVTFDKTAPVVGLKGSACYSRIEPTAEFTKVYIPVLKQAMLNSVLPCDGLNGKRYSTRQFDKTTIYEGYNINSEKPIYFPHKILDLAMLADVNNRTQAYAYKKCSGDEAKSLSRYMDYIMKFFTDDLKEYTVYCFKRYMLANCPDDSIKELADSGHPLYSAFFDEIRARMHYYATCVTTVCILTQLETEKKKLEYITKESILLFRFKVTSTGALMSNKDFCNGVSQLKFGSIYEMGNPPITESGYIPDFMGYTDYAYTLDEEKVNCRPQYAYKVLAKLQEQGNTVDWSNILLGKYEDGSICTSGMTSKVKLQDAKTTWILAGSRAGKGVMSYNIFSTALASGIPLFYMDRKPDTSVVLRGLARKRGGGDLYSINGAQREFSVYDFEHVYEPSVPVKMPKYFATKFSENAEYDMAYLRGILLVYALASFMDAYKADEAVTITPAYKKLESLLEGKTLMVVLDEFSNFMSGFGNKLTTRGLFGSDALSKTGISKTYSNICLDLTSVKKAYASELRKSEDKRSQTMIQQLEEQATTAISMISVDDKTKLLLGLYLRQLGEDLLNVCNENANFVRSSGKYSINFKYFIIGQTNPVAYVPVKKKTDIKFANGSGEKAWNITKDEDKNTDINPLLELIVQGRQAFLMGYNDREGNSLARSKSSSKASSWLTEARRGFAYYSLEDDNIKETFAKIKDSDPSWVNKNWTFFKPFCILNNAEEPDDELKVWSEDIANNSTAVEALWEKRRFANKGKFVAQSLHVANLGGMTWDELVAENDDGTGHLHQGIGFEGYCAQMGSDTLYKTLSLSGEIMDVFVKEVLQYPDGWEKFIHDFTPEAMFDHEMAKVCLLNGREAGVRHHLANTFLSPQFTMSKTEIGSKVFTFADIMGDTLETLMPYYTDTHDSTGTGDISEDNLFSSSYSNEDVFSSSNNDEDTFSNSNTDADMFSRSNSNEDVFKNSDISDEELSSDFDDMEIDDFEDVDDEAVPETTQSEPTKQQDGTIIPISKSNTTETREGTTSNAEKSTGRTLSEGELKAIRHAYTQQAYIIYDRLCMLDEDLKELDREFCVQSLVDIAIQEVLENGI